MVLPLQILAASTVYFDSIFAIPQHSVVSSVPSIILSASSLTIRVSIQLNNQCKELENGTAVNLTNYFSCNYPSICYHVKETIEMLAIYEPHLEKPSVLRTKTINDHPHHALFVKWLTLCTVFERSVNYIENSPFTVYPNCIWKVSNLHCALSVSWFTLRTKFSKPVI